MISVEIFSAISGGASTCDRANHHQSLLLLVVVCY